MPEATKGRLERAVDRQLQRLVGRHAPHEESRMKLSIELTEAESEKLRAEAARLGVEPEALARAALADLLSNEEDDFREAAEYVLRKNEELYRRLA
jgi:hypothetical protein